MYSFDFVFLKKKKKKKRPEILTVVSEGWLPQFLICADEDIYYVYSAGFFPHKTGYHFSTVG